MNEAAISRTKELSPDEWHALNSLADDIEPVEAVFRSLHREGFTPSADEFLAIMFALFSRGFVTIRQASISGFGQQFAERTITPSQPHEIVGDLDSAFREAYSLGDYLHHVAIPADSTPAGVPFGIYFDLTPAGRTEWNKPIYESFFQ